MGDCRVILCEAPQPEVQFTVDRYVMVMKRYDMNLISQRGKCLAHIHAQHSQEWPYGLCAETFAHDKHHLVQCYFCCVSTFIYFKRDRVQLGRIVFTDTICSKKRMCWHYTSSVCESGIPWNNSMIVYTSTCCISGNSTSSAQNSDSGRQE